MRGLSIALTILTLLAATTLAVFLAGCQSSGIPIREMDNGASGKETWSLPVPDWPSIALPGLPSPPGCP